MRPRPREIAFQKIKDEGIVHPIYEQTKRIGGLYMQQFRGDRELAGQDAQFLRKLLSNGSDNWNEWRSQNSEKIIYLYEQSLAGADLSSADLSDVVFLRCLFGKAELVNANLSGAYLLECRMDDSDLRGADLSDASFVESRLRGSDFSGTNLDNTDFSLANLNKSVFVGANGNRTIFRLADLSESKFSGSTITDSDFRESSLRKANMSDSILKNSSFGGASIEQAQFFGTNLKETDFTDADLTGSNLQEANLVGSRLVRTNLTNTTLTNARVFGASVWDVDLKGAEQSDLVVVDNSSEESLVRVGNLKTAQLIYTVLDNEEVGGVIESLGSKIVLILGRFKKERKAVLEAIKAELRKNKQTYVPVIFDFDNADNRDLVETVSVLARLSRFVIADLSDPNSIGMELMSFAKDVPSTPVQLIFTPTDDHARPMPLIDHLLRFQNVSAVHSYKKTKDLLDDLNKKLIPQLEVTLKKLNE